MSEADPFEEALIQNQAPAEAVEIMSAIKDGLAATFSSVGASAFTERDALSRCLRSLQERQNSIPGNGCSVADRNA